MMPLYTWLGRGNGGRPEDYPGVVRFLEHSELARAAAEQLGLPVVQSADGFDVTVNTPEDALMLGRVIGAADRLVELPFKGKPFVFDGTGR